MCTQGMEKEASQNYFCMQTESIEGFEIHEDIGPPKCFCDFSLHSESWRTIW